MSLDYSAYVGYGFFVDRHPNQELEQAEGLFRAVRETNHIYVDGRDLLSITRVSNYDSPRVFVAISRSLMHTNPKSSEYDSLNPFVIKDFHAHATKGEMEALTEIAEMLGFKNENFKPDNFFFVNVS